VDRVCPLLGLQGDRRSAIDGVDGSHRCFAEDPPSPLDRPQQARVCLTDAHERCPRFLAFRARHDGIHPGRSRLGDGLVSTRMVLTPEPSWRGIAGRARRARNGQLGLAGAGAAAIGIGGIALAAGMLGGLPSQAADAGGTVPSSTPTATASPRPTRTPIPSATPSSTPIPTIPPTPTPVPTALPTPAPTAAPPQPRTYVVQQGDTLASIAQQFGTTVAVIRSANGIDDPNSILIGQVLVIP
jgi:LysM repeat protein